MGVVVTAIFLHDCLSPVGLDYLGQHTQKIRGGPPSSNVESVFLCIHRERYDNSLTILILHSTHYVTLPGFLFFCPSPLLCWQRSFVQIHVLYFFSPSKPSRGRSTTVCPAKAEGISRRMREGSRRRQLRPNRVRNSYHLSFDLHLSDEPVCPFFVILSSFLCCFDSDVC